MLDVTIIYKGDISEYSKVDWIQNYFLKDEGGTVQSVDYANWLKDGSANPPFYFPTDQATNMYRNQLNKSNGGQVFLDIPSLSIITESSLIQSSYFIGEVGLVGLKNGKWEHIATFMYGFTSNKLGTSIFPPPMRLPGPSNFQRSLINQANQ